SIVGEASQRRRLAGAIDDGTEDAARQEAVGDLESVRREVADPEIGRDPFDDLGEPAADQREPVAQPFERPDHRTRAWGVDQRLVHVVQRRDRYTLEQAYAGA